jgi:co-chaperonin GroES (HSP10)
VTSITPIAGKAVVQLIEPETTSKAGLFLLEDTREKPTEAVVVSSGLPDVEPGDKVLLSGPYAGAQYVVDDVVYITVVQDEVLAVIS